MKQTFAILFLALSLTGVHGDVVVKKQIQSAMQNGIITFRISGNKTRRDMPTERLGDVSVIQYLNTGQTITMIHRQKIAKMESADEHRQKADELNRNSLPVPKLLDTGKAGKLGNYETEVYSWTNNRDMGGKLWVAKNYPDFQKIQIQLKRLEQSPAMQMIKGNGPAISDLPGMVVKSQRQALGETITETLISVKEEPANPADFEIPNDYHVIGLQITTNSPPAR
jgi:Domain of unknown function (DUF4412)